MDTQAANFYGNVSVMKWYDLKYELSDHVDIEPNLINIAVNNRLVFF